MVLSGGNMQRALGGQRRIWAGPPRTGWGWRTSRRDGGGGLVAKLCPTLATPWTVVRQAPLSMEFSRQEYWSGLPFPSPGDLPDPAIKPGSPALQAGSLLTEL